ncbi:ABC transporter ATP-binding protein [Cupriavidus basilensis]
MRDPQVFLFDEPLSNLDAKLRVQMRAEIKELHQRLRTTSVYVTHDQIEAMTMGDQIVVMRDGRVEQRGKPLDLYDHPDNLFVAGFIGSPAMNFVPGVLRRQGGETVVEFPDGTRLPPPARFDASAGTDGQRVIYGVRPEHLSLGAPGEGLPNRVSVVEPTGANTEIYSRFCETDFISIFRERHDFAAGDILNLVPDHQHTHLFDADTGQSAAAARHAGCAGRSGKQA